MQIQAFLIVKKTTLYSGVKNSAVLRVAVLDSGELEMKLFLITRLFVRYVMQR